MSKRKSMGGHERPNKGKSDSWVTPRVITDAIGPFDLDPCEASPQPWRHAKRGFSIEDDGYAQNWTGRVWLNPPYRNPRY
jgi:hypothetical protein